MSDTITIPEGTRFRLDGQSFEVTEAAEVPAIQAEPVKAQKNRHLKMACPSGTAECTPDVLWPGRGWKPGERFFVRGSARKLLGIVRCPGCDQLLVEVQNEGDDND